MARGKGSLTLRMIASVLVIFVVLAQDDNIYQFVHYDFRKADMYLDGMATTEDGRLRLTNSSEIATGHAFLNTPISFRTSFSFSTEFVFAIIPEESDNYGQVMAFLVSPTTHLKYGAAASYLGIFNKTNDNRTDNHILAVELDTNQNPEALDKSDNHIGINVNSIVSVKSENASYYDDTQRMNRSLVLGSKQRIHTWIEYDEEQRLLNVTLAPFGIPKPSLPLLAIPIELSKVFKEQMYFGFSGSTSKIKSIQYVLGWALAVGGKAQSLDEFKVLDLPRPPPHKPQPVLTKGQVITISLISAVLIVMIPSGIMYLYFKKTHAEEFEQWEQEYSPHRFAFRTLYKATGGFEENRVLGVGGFGKVYRGDLPDGSQIAVKRISHDSRQGLIEYVSEIATMGRLGHRNVVQLLGYCRLNGELLLVYEYMINGNVSSYLSGLSWSQRVHIVKGVASALHYLHEGWDKVVLHRDVKASNVLLDADLNAKLGDFGLARVHDRGMALENTPAAGTVGYMAPELTGEGVATTMTDVFAFGAFVLEVICGRRPIDSRRPIDQANLVQWVANCGRRGCLMEDAIDSQLVGNFKDEEAMMLLNLGMICSQNKAEDRPKMGEVVQYLEGKENAPTYSFDSDVARTLATTAPSGNYALETVTVIFEGR